MADLSKNLLAGSTYKSTYDANEFHEKNNHNKENKEEEYWMLCAFQITSSSVMPMVMQAVLDLGVLEIISKAGENGVSADKIASKLEINAHKTTHAVASSMLDRMLCLLAAHSILICTYSDTTTNATGDQMRIKRRLYRLSPIAKYFIPNSDGICLGPAMTVFQDKIYQDSWREVKPAVLEGGIPFNRAHGMNAFDYHGKDERFNEVFNKAMNSVSTLVITEILNSYKGFEHIQQLVDVGGCLGAALELITAKYPHIKGINFDLPHVIQNAPPYPGVEHVAGDMFASVPSGDAILMKGVLHDWNDEHCLKILKKCYKALPKSGKVIVLEVVVPLIPDNSPATQSICQIDLIMMTQSPGGRERTKQEFLSLATGAGFAGIRFACFACNFWVMEFHK